MQLTTTASPAAPVSHVLRSKATAYSLPQTVKEVKAKACDAFQISKVREGLAASMTREEIAQAHGVVQDEVYFYLSTPDESVPWDAAFIKPITQDVYAHLEVKETLAAKKCVFIEQANFHKTHRLKLWLAFFCSTNTYIGSPRAVDTLIGWHFKEVREKKSGKPGYSIPFKTLVRAGFVCIPNTDKVEGMLSVEPKPNRKHSGPRLRRRSARAQRQRWRYPAKPFARSSRAACPTPLR